MRKQIIGHDERPSIIHDHAFEPRGKWYTLCKHCGLAESAHEKTTLRPFQYFSDDDPDD